MIQLFKGDCLELLKDIPDGSIDLILTDPPYGTTACKWDEIIPFEPMWKEVNRIIKPKGAIVLFGCEPFSSLLRCSNLTNVRYDWVWEKNPVGFLNSKKMPLKSVENISVFYSNLPTYNPQGLIRVDPKIIKNSKSSKIRSDLKIATLNGGRLKESYLSEFSNFPKQILRFNKQGNKSVHPTQKPIPLLQYLIKTYTNISDKVLDFTMGAGSTGVAAVNLGRDFIGIERNDKYFSIAEKRILEAEQNSLF